MTTSPVRKLAGLVQELGWVGALCYALSLLLAKTGGQSGDYRKGQADQ